jgi:hypothetical protein
MRAREAARSFLNSAPSEEDEIRLAERFDAFALSALSPLIGAAREMAIDEAARIVEEGSETHRANQEDGGYLSRRSPGDIAGLAYAAAIRALSTFPAPVSQWRPISEAPPVEYKRLNLLLWWPHWNKERPILGHLSPFGWRADEALSADGVDPTHWMPLPAPPDTSDGGEG